MKVTLSVIKADVGSIGGHTCPSDQMMNAVCRMLDKAGENRVLIDAIVTFTGDDISLIMSHKHGAGAEVVHKLAWNCFLKATEIAKDQGLYGAGQVPRLRKLNLSATPKTQSGRPKPF